MAKLSNDKKAILITAIGSGVMLLLIAAFFLISYLGRQKVERMRSPMTALVKATEIAAFGESSLTIWEGEGMPEEIAIKSFTSFTLASVPEDDPIASACGGAPYRAAIAEFCVTFERTTAESALILFSGSEGALCYLLDEAAGENTFSGLWRLEEGSLHATGTREHRVTYAEGEVLSRYYDEIGELTWEHVLPVEAGSVVTSESERVFGLSELL